MDENEIEILLVEDSSGDAELALRALKKNNMTDKVLHVKDGVEALEFLFKEGKYAERTLSRVCIKSSIV